MTRAELEQSAKEGLEAVWRIDPVHAEQICESVSRGVGVFAWSALTRPQLSAIRRSCFLTLERFA